MDTVHQAYDGKTERYRRRRSGDIVIVTRCCDCGLTHVEKIRPQKYDVAITVWRDSPRTKHARRMLAKYRKSRNWPA